MGAGMGSGVAALPLVGKSAIEIGCGGRVCGEQGRREAPTHATCVSWEPISSARGTRPQRGKNASRPRAERCGSRLALAPP